MTDQAEPTQEQTDAKFREYGLIFAKLMESARFQELMALYFTFIKRVNEETKEIEFDIVENPPEIIAMKMKGQTKPQEPAIQVVSGNMAQAVLDQAKSGGRRYKDPKRR